MASTTDTDLDGLTNVDKILIDGALSHRDNRDLGVLETSPLAEKAETLRDPLAENPRLDRAEIREIMAALRDYRDGCCCVACARRTDWTAEWAADHRNGLEGAITRLLGVLTRRAAPAAEGA